MYNREKAHEKFEEAKFMQKYGSNKAALDLLNEALLLDPTYVAALRAKVKLCIKVGDKEEAASTAINAVSLPDITSEAKTDFVGYIASIQEEMGVSPELLFVDHPDHLEGSNLLNILAQIPKFVLVSDSSC